METQISIVVATACAGTLVAAVSKLFQEFKLRQDAEIARLTQDRARDQARGDAALAEANERARVMQQKAWDLLAMGKDAVGIASTAIANQKKGDPSV